MSAQGTGAEAFGTFLSSLVAVIAMILVVATVHSWHSLGENFIYGIPLLLATSLAPFLLFG